MKKRALILAMIAFIAATTSEPSINMVRAEETQVEETQTEENAGQTSELPIKTLTPKVMDVNPYMAASSGICRIFTACDHGSYHSGSQKPD